MEESKAIDTKRIATERSGNKPGLFDYALVLVAPPLCFYFNPVFGPSAFEDTGIGFFELACYIVVALSIGLFFATFVPIKTPVLRSFLKGSLVSGLIVSSAFGTFLLPLTIIGLMFVIGVLGFIPFGTAWRYWLRIKAYPAPIREARLIPALVAGAILPLSPGVAIYWAGLQAQNSLINRIQSSDHQAARQALPELGNAWYCKRACVNEALGHYFGGRISLPKEEFDAGFEAATGKRPDDYAPAID